MPKPSMKNEKLHSQRIKLPGDKGVLSKLLMQMTVQLKFLQEYGKRNVEFNENQNRDTLNKQTRKYFF